MKIRDTYIKTNGDEQLITTISGDELKMLKRENGVDTTIVDLHDGALELNGVRVLTENKADMLTSNDFLAKSIPNSASALNAVAPFLTTEADGVAMLDTPNLQANAAGLAFGSGTSAIWLHSGRADLGNGSGAKQIFYTCAASGAAFLRPIGNNPDTELFVKISGSASTSTINQTYGFGQDCVFRKFVLFAPTCNASSLSRFRLNGSGAQSLVATMEGDWYIILPAHSQAYTATISGFFDDANLNLFFSLPATVNTVSFFVSSAPNYARRNKVSEVVYLLDHLGTPTTTQMVFCGITADAGEVKNFEETFGGSTFAAGDWHPTDTELVACLSRHALWSVSFEPTV